MLAKVIVTNVKKDTREISNIVVLERVNYVIIVRLFRGSLVLVVCVFSKVRNASIGINKT